MNGLVFQWNAATPGSYRKVNNQSALAHLPDAVATWEVAVCCGAEVVWPLGLAVCCGAEVVCWTARVFVCCGAEVVSWTAGIAVCCMLQG